MNVDDSYRELGLRPDCSDAELKAAWRRLAARWHPDRNASPHALRKIQRINRALEEIRRARDLNSRFDTDMAPFSRRDEARPAAPPAVHHVVELTLEEAAAGCVKEIEGEVADDCYACRATGLQRHESTCAECGGSGKVRQQLWFGWVAPVVECNACGGRGVTRPACGVCHGSGKAPARQYRRRVRIPPGVRAGDLLHVPGRAQGGAHEDALSVEVRLLPHEFFALDADGTVRCEVPVDGFAWIANRWIEVPTPLGLQQMRLRRDYLVYRIKGQGFPAQGADARSDCIVTVLPLFPEEFTKEQQSRIDKLIASNTRARTEAGERVAAWNRRVDQWKARVGSGKAPPD